MKTIYVRELQHYSKEYLIEQVGEKVNDKLPNSIMTLDNVSGKYQFHYVGVIIIDEIVINCYPKYIHDTSNIHDTFKEIIRVIKKYNSTNDDTTSEDLEIDDNSLNMLPMMLFFIEDYYENGVYTRIRNVLKENTDNEIDWNRTVNNNLTIIKDKQPYYTRLETKYKVNDIYDYFRLLHEYIITECSKTLEKVELLDLFDLTPVEISDNSIEDFGELDFILNKIEKELNIEYNTHKQKLLKNMHSYLSKKDLFKEDNDLLLYGTRTYNNIWEKVCKIVFKDKTNEKLSKLHLPSYLDKKYNPNDKLINVIKKPVWLIKDKQTKETDTFLPDIITIKEDNFTILDAKYYDIKFFKEIEGQPGLESITKQYLYELAFKDFIYDHKFKIIKNAFLFPTEKREVENKGKVTLDILHKLGLKDIQLILLPAHLMYEYFLKNKKMNISSLKLE